MFIGKGVLKICSKFTGEHPCRSLISIKLFCRTLFSEHFYLRTPLGGCFCINQNTYLNFAIFFFFIRPLPKLETPEILCNSWLVYCCILTPFPWEEIALNRAFFPITSFPRNFDLLPAGHNHNRPWCIKMMCQDDTVFYSQLTITCSKSTIKRLENGVKYV